MPDDQSDTSNDDPSPEVEARSGWERWRSRTSNWLMEGVADLQKIWKTLLADLNLERFVPDDDFGDPVKAKGQAVQGCFQMGCGCLGVVLCLIVLLFFFNLVH